MISLKDKTILITGASSGIGRALALRLAKENCNLILCARRLELLKAVDEELKKVNPTIKTLIIKADVSQEKEVANLFNVAMGRFGMIDILVNNAGKGLQSPLHEISTEDWNSVISTNLTGVFLCSREAVKHMLTERIKGHIITVCSIAGLYGAPNYSAYCASKHAVAGFKRSLWLELRKKGIKVSTIYPARVDTEFFSSYDKPPSRKKMISPEDIAEYLISIMKQQKIGRVLNRIKLAYQRARNLVRR
ncbi:SDR family oxidoreductase [Candidatus Woesearchaeota archaeon]|nr:SDR family oxidoreductase [Candidatus Woesearchaeota archaeon]